MLRPNALYWALRNWRLRVRRPVPGRFQPYSHTFPDRYPWLFRFAATALGAARPVAILSFGCSRGDEVFSLRGYFPHATIKGIDFDPRNVARCRARAATMPDIEFAAASTTKDESAQSYDAIFCLGVLRHGHLTNSNAARSDPLIHFADFEDVVTDFARCLKPGGLLLLYATNFRFCDTAVAGNFDTVLEVEPGRSPNDLLFDRNNRLMKGERYPPVAFRKRPP